MDKLRRYFYSEVAEGRLRSPLELKRVSDKRNYGLELDDISELRSSWTPTALRRRAEKPETYQTTSVWIIDSSFITGLTVCFFFSMNALELFNLIFVTTGR